MEVGDYVRTNLGEIAKITYVASENMGEILGDNTYIDIGFCNTKPSVDGKIVKCSKNIIDLVEPDDFVNGCLIETFYDENEEEHLGVSIYDDACMDCVIEVLPLKRMYINEILTHEQYEDRVFRIKKEKIKNGN